MLTFVDAYWFLLLPATSKAKAAALVETPFWDMNVELAAEVALDKKSVDSFDMLLTKKFLF